jgi:hypothetical protein
MQSKSQAASLNKRRIKNYLHKDGLWHRVVLNVDRDTPRPDSRMLRRHGPNTQLEHEEVRDL